MFPTFESIKYFYDINCYTNVEIKIYYEYGCISKEQYKEITGEDYTEEPQA